MKTLKKFVRKLYHLILFLSLFLLFLVPVYATNGEITASIRSSEITQSSQAQCYTDGHNSINTSFISNVGYATYYQCSLNSTQGYLSFNVNHALVSDTLYQVTLYIGNNGNKPMGHSNTNTSIGTGITDANNNNKNGSQRVTVWNFGDTWNIDTLIDVSNGQIDVQPRTSVVHLYFITFTVPNDGKAFLNIPLFFGSSTSQVYYYGYNLQVIGHLSKELTKQDVQNVISNSGLATASSVQEVQRGVNEAKQELNSIDSTLNDSSVDSSDNTINNLKDKIPTNSVISDLLLLPVRFLQNFVNALGGSCSQFNLGSLYGTDLFMPCINLQNYLGSGIWTTIDLIISGLFIYALRKKFIEIWENITNLRNGGNEVD